MSVYTSYRRALDIQPSGPVLSSTLPEALFSGTTGEYQQVTVSSTALTLPDLVFGEDYLAQVQGVCFRAQTAAIRYRYDGGTPAALVGHRLAAGKSAWIVGNSNCRNFTVIRETGSDASLEFTVLMMQEPPVETTVFDYYVDAQAGNDSNNGLTRGAAWRTISQVNGFTFAANDRIGFKRGQVWRETLTVPAANLTFGAYGSGAKPQINGADLVTTWAASEQGSSGTERINDNFDDNDEAGWTDSGGGTHVAQNQREEFTIAGGGADAIYQAGSSVAELWSSFNFQFVSSGLNWSEGNNTQGGGIASSQTTRLFVGLLRNSGNAEYQVRYQNDAGTQTVNTGVVMTPDVNHIILLHYKAATGAGANNGIVQVWADGIALVNLSNVDSDTLTVSGLKLGNNSASAGIVNMVLYIDDVKCGTTGTAPSGAPANTWQAAVTTQPSLVHFDGTKGTLAANIGSVNGANKWFWAANVLTVYSATDPDSAFVTPGIEAAIRTRLITVSSKANTVLENLELVHANTNSDAGVYLNNSDGVIVRSCSIHDSDGFAGVYIEGTGAKQVRNCEIYTISHLTADRGDGIVVDGASGHVFSSNIIHNNTGHGIRLSYSTATSSTLAASNTIYQNGSVGISQNNGGDSNIFEYNLVYANGQLVADTFGIDLFKVGNNNLIRYNICHDHHFISTDAGGIRHDGDPGPVFGTGNEIYTNVIYNERTGVHLLDVDGSKVYGNTIYNSTLYGYLNHGSSADANVFKNNIVHTAGTYLVYNQDATNGVYNHNLYYPDGASAFRFNGSASNFASWKTNSSQDANSAVGDPLFVNAAGADFHIGAGSPAIDNGEDLGVTYENALNGVQGALWDIGAYVE